MLWDSSHQVCSNRMSSNTTSTSPVTQPAGSVVVDSISKARGRDEVL